MCNSTMSLKNKVYNLIKRYFITKKIANHHLGLQQVIIFLLMESLASVLIAADWSRQWFLKVGAAVAISSNKTKMKFGILMIHE